MVRNFIDVTGSEAADARPAFGRREWLRRAGATLAAAGGVLIAPRPAVALTNNQGQTILAAARRMLGTPYAWGGPQFPRNTDCSSLTQWCYAQAGLAIPRRAVEQYRACRFSTNAVGALVFFNTTGAAGDVTHVGINVGNGWFVNANSAAGKVVEERWQGNNYWMPRFVACAAF